MSATLEISVTHPDPQLHSPFGAVVQVRPRRGRSSELTIPLHGTERVSVSPGEVEVEATLPAGQKLFRSVVATEGEVVRVQFQVPVSPHETMRWLSLSREPSMPINTRVRLQPSRIVSFKEAGNNEALLRTLGNEEAWFKLAGNKELWFKEPGNQKVAIHLEALELGAEVGAQRGGTSVQIVTDVDYPEGRVLHVRDDRDPDVLRAGGESGLAMLFLRATPFLDAVRVCALPGPSHLSEPRREVHALLRPVEGDALPDVQMVPTNPALATVVGFLERSDQPSLSAMRDRLSDEAVKHMEAKREDPVAAAVGLAVLLRLGDLERVRGWSWNLWKWFQGFPDGAALHAAVTLREPKDTDEWKADFRDAVLGASKTGAPLLTDSLRHLREAAAVLVDIDDSDAARACARWCDHLMRAVDPDAVFTTLTLPSDQVPIVWGMAHGKEAAQ